MTKHLHYVVPIFLIGLIAGAVPASAAIRSDGGTRDPVAAPAESTDTPIILAQRGGVAAAGVAVAGCVRGGGGGRGGAVVLPAGHGVVMPEEREAVMPGGANRSAAAGSRNWSAFPQATAASTPVLQPHQRQHCQCQPKRQRFRQRLWGGYYGGAGWGGVAAGVAAGAVVGAAATAVATPNYYAAPSGCLLPVPRLSELRALFTYSGVTPLTLPPPPRP